MMDKATIEGLWSREKVDEAARVAQWDAAAKNFHSSDWPTVETDQLLKLFKAEGILEACDSALDIGCGAGKHSVVLGDYLKKIRGIDVSPKMIEYARENAQKKGKKNVHFDCMSWEALDLGAEGMEKAYDLVFARMTPAIGDAKSFEKMCDAAKKWCVMVKPVRRTDSLSDVLRQIAGCGDLRRSQDAALMYAFNLVWLMGYEPHIIYEKKVWEADRSVEDALVLYTNRIRTATALTEEKEAEIKAYLESVAVDNTVHDTTHTTIATLYWQV